MKSWRQAFRRLSAVLIALAFVLSPTAVRANSATFPGQWQQVASGTDACNTCWVEIRRNGPVLKVTGKDGWFAVAHLGRLGGDASAEGIGRWSEDGTSHYRGLPFGLRIALIDEHLYMDMVVQMDDGSTRAIRAIFDKRRSEKTGRVRMARM